MSNQEHDPLTEVDALVRGHLARQVAAVDGAAGLARVRAALDQERTLPRARRRGRRLAWVVGIAAALGLAFLGGLHLGPAQAGTHDLVRETQRVHNLPLERCYLATLQRGSPVDDDRSVLDKAPRQVRVWTRGDRFWVEVRHETPFIWGREEDGSLWAVLDAGRGVRVSADQATRPLTVLADVYSLNVDALLGNVLHGCTLTEASSSATPLTRVVVAKPAAGPTRLWLDQATLEIDVETKALRRLVVGRNRLGVPFATVTFTLVETRPAEDAKYHLEGHLTAPFRIHEGNIEPRVKLELLRRWLGFKAAPNALPPDHPPLKLPADKEAFLLKDVDGHAQAPLTPGDNKALVFFFLLPDCPISNAYGPEIKRLCSCYEPRKVALYVVHADPDVSAEQAKKHAREYGFACPVLCDPAHDLVKRTGVTMAPEVAVLAPDLQVLYRGRIDDLYVDYGKRRAEPTQRDLRDALDAILRGQAVTSKTTKVIGCYLPEPM